jgi:hypothetical protein
MVMAFMISLRRFLVICMLMLVDVPVVGLSAMEEIEVADMVAREVMVTSCLGRMEDMVARMVTEV